MQICAIILAPTFICVSIYLTLKHIALHIAPETSRFAPKWYPRIFLPADLSCLIVQAIGGGIAAAAGHDKPKLQKDGNRAIIAGVVLQVMVLFMFGILGTDYFIRVRRRFRANEGILPEQRALYNDKKFRMFVSAITGAYMAVLIRCIYRYVLVSAGWLFVANVAVLRKWPAVGATTSCRMSRPSLSSIALSSLSPSTSSPSSTRASFSRRCAKDPRRRLR